MTFRTFGLAGFLWLAWYGTAWADPLILSYVPNSQTVSVGPAVVDVFVSGFGPNTASSVGDFDLSVTYDPGIVSATGVAFGGNLGDPGLVEALTDFDVSTPGVVEFKEVSLLAPADLEALQAPLLAGGFFLAELSFDLAGNGTTPLTFTALTAGNSLGENVPLEGGTGSITVVPEPRPVAFVACLVLAALFLRRRLHRIWTGSVCLLVASALLPAAPPPNLGPRIKLKDKQDNDTGIEYAVGTTKFPVSGRPRDMSKSLVTPMRIFNTTKNDQRLIVCLTGVTDNLGMGAIFRHMQIQMKLDANNTFTCELPNAQNLEAKRFRRGSMGCRLIGIPAGKDADATFVSGNDRTIPVFDANGLPAPGQFSKVEVFGGIGPTQTGTVGSGNASSPPGGVWGAVGGHPDSKTRVQDHLSYLDLHFILLQDNNLKFAADGNPLPARDDGKAFNCNKCFGMGPGGDGKTSLGLFRGYHLAPLSADDQKNIKAIFAHNWVHYDSLELRRGSTSLSKLSLSSDATFFASGPTQAQYKLDAVNLPPGCSIASLNMVDEQGNSSPLSPLTAFNIEPRELRELAVAISCDSTLSPGSAGQLIATISNLDSSNPGILSQSFLRIVAPLTCDVNVDGSVDQLDISEIMALAGTPAAPGDPHDVDGDGMITVNDARKCTLLCSLPLCAVPPLQ